MKFKSCLYTSYFLIFAAIPSATYADSWTTGTSGQITSGTTTKVGVGKTNPGRTLDVNGTVRASSIEGNGIFPVIAYGAKITNSDNTTQFQAALTAASSAGGGTVLVPPGSWALTGTLIIPPGVTLQGSWSGPHDALLNQGTTLLASSGRGSTTGAPFITLDANLSKSIGDAGIRGVTIFYPAQNNPSSIAQYPWTISGGFDCDIENVTLANSYLGIRTTSSSYFIRNVNMSAFSQGVSIDDCWDVGRLENIHIHPKFFMTATGWTYTSDPITNEPTGNLRLIINFTIKNLIGFAFAQTDWTQVSGCFVIWSKIGMQFNLSSVAGGGPTSGEFINCGVDVSQSAIQINYSEIAHGLSFTNCQFVGQVVIGPTSQGVIRFAGCSFSAGNKPENPNKATALIYSNSTESIFVSNSSFWDWDIPAARHGCVTLDRSVGFFSQNDFRQTVPLNPVLGLRWTYNPGVTHFNLFNGAKLSAVNTRFGSALVYNVDATSTATFSGSIVKPRTLP